MPASIVTELGGWETLTGTPDPRPTIQAIEALTLAGDASEAARLGATARMRMGTGWKAAIHDKWNWDGRARRRDATADLGDGIWTLPLRSFAPLRPAPTLRIGSGRPSFSERWPANGRIAVRPYAGCEQAASVPPNYGKLYFRVYSEPGMIESLASCYEKMGDFPKARERERRVPAHLGEGRPGHPAAHRGEGDAGEAGGSAGGREFTQVN